MLIKLQNWLKEKWNTNTGKILLFIDGLILLVFLGMFFWLIFQVCWKKPLIQGEISKLYPTTVSIDKNGNIHSDIKTTQNYESLLKAQVDSLNIVLKGRVKIEEVTRYITKTDTIFKQIPIYIDTINKTFSLEKKDNYIVLSVNGNYSSLEAKIGLKSIDTITYISYEKKHFFKANERQITIVNKNPYNHINEGSSLVLKESKPIIIFGPQVGIGLNLKPYFGVGVTFNLISIKSNK